MKLAPNPHILQRFKGCRDYLMGLYASGTPMSNNSKGIEREIFVSKFLEQSLPLPYRFGSGEITDLSGNISRQMDIVVEFPLLPSFSSNFPGSPRLYLADGVAAVIEVKSDLESQWDNVVSKAKSVASLKRDTSALTAKSSGGMSIVAPTPLGTRERIPFIAIGYKGWSNKDSLSKKLSSVPDDSCIDAALIIDTELFASHPKGELSGLCSKTGPLAFWALLSVLHQSGQYISDTGIRLSDYMYSFNPRVPRNTEELDTLIKKGWASANPKP